jgi:hypothetical protein
MLVVLTILALAAGDAVGQVRTWSLRQRNPRHRSQHAMAYDSSRGITLLIGGQVGVFGSSGAPMTRTWGWDGREWRVLATTGPAQIDDPAMVGRHSVVATLIDRTPPARGVRDGL